MWSAMTSILIIAILLQAIVAALFMNIYIVGLNQLSDIEIDKVLFCLVCMNLISECRTMQASFYLCEGLVEDSYLMFLLCHFIFLPSEWADMGW